MTQTLKFGSLYVDGKPTTLGAEYQPRQSISFGEATSNEPISWVPVNGLLIADRCLLTDISWDDLDAQGLVFGKEAEVQGFNFRARLLRVGSEDGVPNEWDTALDTVGEDNDLWHWKDEFFWGQETVSLYGSASRRANRGYDPARTWHWNYSSDRHAHLGFRPALEFLPSDISDLRLGQEIMAIGRDGGVMGKLVNKTQYDLILQPKSGGVAGEAAFAANTQDGTLAVDRSGILSIAAA